MKIKCPSCGLEEDYSDYISFKNHCRDSHPRDSLREYAKQTFKIHERKEHWIKTESEVSTSLDKSICQSMREEIESLLENKK
jgi:hypothetical protein